MSAIEIHWGPAEWLEGNEPYAGHTPGFELSVTPPPPRGDEMWFWIVRLTSRRSEWPEVLDSGSEKTEAAAKAAAEAAVRKEIAASGPTKERMPWH